MKPSTKVELAISGMIELASRTPSKPLALAVLAEKQSISLSYLEQVFASLRRNGLVVSVRGPGGGYLLSRPANQIDAGAIITAVDGPSSKADQDGEGQISAIENKPMSLADTFWARMNEQVLDLYRQVSLQDILDGQSTTATSLPETTPQAAE